MQPISCNNNSNRSPIRPLHDERLRVHTVEEEMNIDKIGSRRLRKGRLRTFFVARTRKSSRNQHTNNVTLTVDITLFGLHGFRCR